MIGLLCDDEAIVRESLSLYLKEEGIDTEFAADGAQALEQFRTRNYDFIVLDLMMPYVNGLEVCKEIRKTSSVPVLLLTARGEEIDKILGFELGADDYIVKPFSAREVVARIKAILRRTQNQSAETSVVKVEGLSINIQTYSVKHDNRSLEMTPKEVEILYLIASHPHQVFTREHLLNSVWGYTYYGDTRSVDTHIKRIRAKLPESHRDFIKTIYGVGYKFEANP